MKDINPLGVWTLIDTKTNRPASIGQTFSITRDGVTHAVTLTGGRPPHKSSSSGFIYIKSENGSLAEYYASVIDCKWVLDYEPTNDEISTPNT